MKQTKHILAQIPTFIRDAFMDTDLTEHWRGLCYPTVAGRLNAVAAIISKENKKRFNFTVQHIV